MKKPAINYRISQLIARSQIEELTVGQTRELEDWVNETNENKALYEAIKEGGRKTDRDTYVEGLDLKMAWKNIEAKTNLKRNASYRMNTWLASAAAILICGLLLTTFIYITRNNEVQQVAEHPVIEPGSSKAILQLNNGDVVQLENAENNSFTEEDGTRINNEEGELNYASLKNSEKTLYNTVKVPVNGEYQLKLADGTQVWLNADSEIRFPVQFTGNNRKVWVKGEVYFEVKHIDYKPFIVVAEEGVEIEVLGTKFNVMAYEDANNIETTLVDGVVKVNTSNNKSVELRAGEQARVSRSDRNTKVLKVNTDLYTAWTKGRFLFEDEELESILTKLSRWYDIEVFYQNKSVKKKRLSADLKRYDDITQFLDLVSPVISVDFEINNRTLIVKEK